MRTKMTDEEYKIIHTLATKRWQENNKEHYAKLRKNYYENNREKILEYGKKWAKDNREHVNKKIRERRSNKTKLERRISKLKAYCKELELVENYELAKLDNFDSKLWCLHHKLENYWKRKTLIRKGLYYSVNPESLIFLRNEEHNYDASQATHHPERSKWHKRILEK